MERYSSLVLLGGPGSGKSTVTRHLAWSHALANLPNLLISNIPLLSGNPLPLRIELRRLAEARRQHPNYDFLSYSTDVLLGREGIEINLQMFKNLLEQKKMLLLFDGLDEVATLDERRVLVEEIEHFAQLYPGNRIVVTSRPQGYNIARFSDQQFSHAKVQQFDNSQIWQFLEHWYVHVLRLSPIPRDDQQELDELFTALKDNPRLHKLAENPLLLTVITALHRYERLPDKRVLIYDRCADLLLETWAKLKGTNLRWKDMKMVKDDQYACVAHLGFVLHERSQEKEFGDSEEDSLLAEEIASDVSSRFMMNEIERFLKSRKLITEIIEQRSEAKRFLELIQEEAGLIVERGKDENGEDLYGFVHRTFQEYFAAIDVYERFQQEVNLTIIAEFLREQLHDPHWREVILLLLGKLKPKPVTNQLRQVLEGQISSRRSHSTGIVQQDIFFVCDCLAEEIAVESELATIVVFQLSGIVKHSPFSSQRNEALNYLSSFMQTRLYADLGEKELTTLVFKEGISDVSTRLVAIQTLYNSDSKDLNVQQKVIQILDDLAQLPNLTFQQRLQVIETLYECSSRSLEHQLADQILLRLTSNSNLTIEQQIQVAGILYLHTFFSSKEERQALAALSHLAQLPTLSIEQQIQVAETLYWCREEEQREAFQILSRLAQHPDLTIDQQIQVAEVLYECNSTTQEKLRANQMLIDLVQSHNLSVREQGEVAQALYRFGTFSSKRQQIVQMTLNPVHLPDLSIEQQLSAAENQYNYRLSSLKERRYMVQLLLNLTQIPDLTIEQQVQVAESLNRWTSPSEKVRQGQTINMLSHLVQIPDLSIEQQIHITQALYRYSEKEQRQQLIQSLSHLSQLPNLSVEQEVQAAAAFYESSTSSSKEERESAQMLLNLVQDHKLSSEQQLQVIGILIATPKENYSYKLQALQKLFTMVSRDIVRDFLEERWQTTYSKKADSAYIKLIIDFAKNDILPAKVRDEMYQLLSQMVPQFNTLSEDDR